MNEKMKTVDIKSKLLSLGVEPRSVVLGDFDVIGEYTAKKCRDRNDANYGLGAFFRPNYERGILIDALIRTGNLSSYIEVGFGRGYSAICAARAFYEIGNESARVVTVDVKFDREHIKRLASVFPPEVLRMIDFHEGRSEDLLPTLKGPTSGGGWDLVYIDGDHTESGTKKDWNALADRFGKHLLFDDYREPTDTMRDIDCANVIDLIDPVALGCEMEYVKMDRLMFLDDRYPGMPSDASRLKYGQVLLTKLQGSVPPPDTDKMTSDADDWNE